VGTVWFAWATPGGLRSEMQLFAGDRAQVRHATVQHSLAVLLGLVRAAPAA
jgi:nicotinamide-nucleotide amidase